MNLYEQIGALEAGIEQLLRAAAARPMPVADEQAKTAPADQGANVDAHAESIGAQTRETTPAVDMSAAVETTEAHEAPEAPAQAAEAQSEPADAKLSLAVARPSQHEITMTIGGQTVSLHPLQVGQLIEELANARASMQPEPPPAIPPGWRFASTRNPMLAVQKQSNGDRLLVLRHTGHGWVPFSFSPDMVVQMYMMLTQR